MEQVKIFSSGHSRSLQEFVNKWLAENADKLEITRVLQSSVGLGSFGDVRIFITIFSKNK